MDRQLSAAVIAAFRGPDAAIHRECLSRFSACQWNRNFHWLDASGLALYLLERLRALDITEAVPQSVVAQLQQRRADNQQRTASLFDEFVRLNAAFRADGLGYVNLKGFTLVPDYCPDLSLRYQIDSDFLMHARDAQRCADILAALGYSPVARKRYVIELKTDAGRTPNIRELYKPRPQSAVEVHLCDDSTDSEFRPDLLRCAKVVAICGHVYPCLSTEDMFLCQASHLFRHVRSEWTRASWLLELKNFITGRRADSAFWHAMGLRAAQQQGSVLAVGAAVRLAEKAFGHFAPEELTNWSSRQLPESIALWIEHYGDEVLLADFPGSKLYLILEGALAGDRAASLVRTRLFPLRVPAPFVASPAAGFVRARAAKVRASYFFFRLRFHIASGLQYFVEAWRWNRLRGGSVANDSRYRADYAPKATP